MAKKKPRRSPEEMAKLMPKVFEAIDVGGVSPHAAAAANGVSATVVNRWVRARAEGKAPDNRRAQNRPVGDTVHAERAAYAAKHGAMAAAEHYGVTHSAIYLSMKRAGVPTQRTTRPRKTNGHAETAQPLAASRVWGATSRIMQILEPLSEAERSRVLSATTHLVQAGIE